MSYAATPSTPLFRFVFCTGASCWHGATVQPTSIPWPNGPGERLRGCALSRPGPHAWHPSDDASSTEHLLPVALVERLDPDLLLGRDAVPQHQRQHAPQQDRAERRRESVDPVAPAADERVAAQLRRR